MKFNKITQEEMDLAVAKFQKNNVGVRLNNLTTVDTHYSEMLDASHTSISQLKSALKHYGRAIKYKVKDPILGDSSAFYRINNRDERITFTHEECYLMIRAAIVERQNDAEYIAKKKEIAELTDWLNANKTVSQRKKEVQARLNEIEKEV